MVQEAQAELADLALDEQHATEAESLIRPAIVEFEQEKSDPASASAYTVLSRALLMQGKIAEADKSIQHAAELTRTSPDPNLKLPVVIQTARIEIAEASSRGAGLPILKRARQRLQSTVATANRLGYYMLEREARLELGKLEMNGNPAGGRAQLTKLAAAVRHDGLELLAREAEQALTSPGLKAASTPPR